jgi:uronate dehydrogenase
VNVLLTGAAGRIGTMLRARLPGYGVQLRLLDRKPLDGAMVGDVADPAMLDQALGEPTDAIVHLAGQPTEAPWPVIRDVNIEGTFQVFEAARRHGVRRIVYASTGHVTGYTERGIEDLPADAPLRPDTLYGVSKAFGEALARYYVDRYDLQIACLRIGTCAETPADYRARATWLSPDDCARLVQAALTAPDLTYATVWGISANTRRWWTLDAGQAIGYEPLDDAETFTSQLPSDDFEPLSTDDLVGGGFATPEFGIDEVVQRWTS